MYVTGGRGGSVYVVNNLMDYADGTPAIPGHFAMQSVSRTGRLFSVFPVSSIWPDL